jgi:hypothetical protein
MLAFPTSALPVMAHQMPRAFDPSLIQAEERLRAAPVFPTLLTEEVVFDEPGDRIAHFADAPVDVLLEESPPRHALECVGGLRVAQKISEHVDSSLGNLCLPRTRRHRHQGAARNRPSWHAAPGAVFVDEDVNPTET